LKKKIVEDDLYSKRFLGVKGDKDGRQYDGIFILIKA